MKTTIISILLIIGSGSLFGQLNFGAGAQLTLDNGAALGVQGKALYEIDETWRGAGSFTFYLADVLDFAIDLDAQYKLIKVSDKFDLAPLAGLNIASGSAGNVDFTDLGINLGAFLDFVPNDSYHIYIEPKIVLGGLESLVISGGILF
jgi:hypothetical protein